MAGYSPSPLIKKLGLKPGHSLLLTNAPADYSEILGCDVTDQLCSRNEIPDFVHLFVKNRKDLYEGIEKLKPLKEKNHNIIVWISWYKKSSGIVTDVTEDVIRNQALKNGLVDVKVCAVSDEWSGLKLVVPLKLR